MKKSLLIVIFAAALVLQAKERPQDLRLVRIFIDTPEQAHYLREQSFDFASSYFGRYADAVLSAAQHANLHARGYNTRVLHDQASVNRFARSLSGDMGAYHTYQEISDELAAIAQAYPQITRLHSIGKSIESRDLWALKISDHPELEEADEPGVLYTGNIHAREIITPEIIMDFMQILVNGYGADAHITHLVDNRQLWLIPMINPDGHVRVEIGDYFWRKNRRLNPDSTYGVDLNRNFSFQWGYDNIGSSSRTGRETYRGTAPFSEPETQALRDLVTSHSFVAALNYHSYGRMCIFPWGYISQDTPHHDLFMDMGQNLTRDNGYMLGNTRMGVIYMTNGDSDDYLYHEETNKGSIFAFTVEVGQEFLPSEDDIFSLIAEVRAGNFYLAEAAGLLIGNPYRILRPPTPALTVAQANDDGRFSLTWNKPYADPNTPVAYDVEELIGYRSGCDDAESSALIWDLQGFARTSQRVFAGQFAYGAALDEGKTATMTTLYSMIPHKGDSLRFRIWFDLEKNMDYAYVRVSEDQGATYTNIRGNITSAINPYGMNAGNGITGTSNGWISAAFDLSWYAGKSILVQFRYQTDALYQGQGVYIDDVGLVTMVDAHHLLAESIAATSLPLQKTLPGDYAFRVRGIDPDGQVSNWSALKQSSIDFGGRGDVVRDGVIQANDLERFIAMLDSAGTPATAGECFRANVDTLVSGELNIIDLVTLQRQISGDSLPMRPQAGQQILRFQEAAGNPGDRIVSRLTLHLTQPVAGMQFMPHLSDDRVILDSLKITAASDPWRVSRREGSLWYYSPQPAKLDSGAHAILEVHFHIADEATPGTVWLQARDVLLCTPSGDRILDVKSDSAAITIHSACTGIADDQQPRQPGMARGYPNPFNGEITIRFQVPPAEPVNLQVFNLTGECIYEAQRPARGEDVQEWKLRADGWPSGIYFVRLSAGSVTAGTKIVLLR